MSDQDEHRPEFQPFEFFTEAHLVEVTGISAKNLNELLDNLHRVSGSVIYCHTFKTMLEHHFITEGFRNDFALWIMDSIGDEELGERLSSIDLIDYVTLRDYRMKMIEIIKDHLSVYPEAGDRPAKQGNPFFFCEANTYFMTTYRVANTLEEFANHLRRSSRNSIFFHFIESRLRVGATINDFSVWMIQSLGMNELGRKINALDPYKYSLDDLKDQICELVETEL
ncbi:MAG TPA: DUF5752 family protein [bacterium]|nr:DUF5752 family protein [bacterium]